MTRPIRLPKELVIRCFALCRQAERSVDRALFAPWDEFVAYYGPDRVSALEAVVARLTDTLLQPGVAQAPPRFEEVYPRELRLVFGFLLSKLPIFRKSTFGFREPEIRFVLARLQALLNVLASKERPAQDELIALRMAMYDCQRLLEWRCPWMPELNKALRIEHLFFPEHLVPVTMAELLQECP